MERPPVLIPGRNCWCTERADQLAFLIDGQAYFEAFRAAALQAQQSILILAWDIDSRIELVRGPVSDRLPTRLNEFLQALLKQKPSLHIHILGWDYAFIYALEREWLSHYKLGWVARRLHFEMDRSTRLVAAITRRSP